MALRAVRGGTGRVRTGVRGGASGSAAPVMPAGALGVWYADTFDSVSKAIPNQATVQTLSQNVLRWPRRQPTGFTVNALTETYSGGVGPDGLSEATLLAATAGGWYWFKSQTLSAGTYTLGLHIKSNSGSDQTFQMGLATGLTTKTALAAGYTRVSVTFTVGAGNASIYIIKDPTGATTGTSFLLCNYGLYPGSSDLGATSGYDDPVGHLYLGSSSQAAQPSYSSGVIDFTSSGFGVIQLPTASAGLSTFTALAVVNKTAAGGAYQAYLSKAPGAYDKFSAMIEQGSGVLQEYFNLQTLGSKGQTANLQGRGWHFLCARFDGTYLEWWLDGMLFQRANIGAQSVNIADLWAFTVNGTIFTGASMNSTVLYNRALSKAEIDSALAVLTSRAAVSSLTVAPPSTVWYAEGDSITATVGGWVNQAYPNLTAGIQVGIWAEGGAIMSNPTTPTANSLWGRASALNTLGLPTNKAGKKLILSVLIGANDLSGYASGSAYATDLTAYLNAQRAAGFTKIVGCTVTNRANSSAFTTNRNQLNPLIRNMVGSGVLDAVIDFAADSIMGVDGVGAGGTGTTFGNTASGATGPYNTDYFLDGLHPTSAGYLRLANIAYPVINAL